MGLVFKAKDFHLGREVALKVLPEGLTADPERVARFEREARLLATLNHPNIAQIYGFETAPDGARALVMELVEGPTLAERLAQGSLPVDESLSLARQIAEALEEAHERGIVHRDLKPQNIKASIEGKVKVLDFGLAKAMDPTASAPGVPGAGGAGSNSPTLMNSPTLTAIHGTQLGVILGTAAYMSPEQARGQAVDRRADIWAFGVILWEMLAGRRLFEGETVTDTLAGVLKSEVDFAGVPAAVPPAIRRLLRRCLERDPRRRLRDIGEARIAIDEVLRGVAEEAPTDRAPAADRRAGRRWIAAAALALAMGVALGSALGRLSREPAGSAAEVESRWALAIPEGLTLATPEYPQLALSADGSLQVAVVVDESAKRRLLLRRRDEFEARLLPDSEGASSPFLSPDAAWIGFFRDNALYKIPVAGGPPIRLAPTSGQNRGGTWSRDGFIYFAGDTNVPLSRVPEGGGVVEPFTRLDESRDERTHRWPQALPDGSAVLFTSDTQASTEYYDDARIEVARTATGERKVLVEGASQARSAGGDHLVFARGGTLYAVGFDARTLAVRGNPVPAVQGVATDVGSGAAQVALAESGAALWTPGGTSDSYRIVWVDRSGAETLVPVPPAPYNELALAPDGKRLALVGGQGGVADLWVAELDRGTLTRLTFGDVVRNPVWTPDGSRIAYGTRKRSKENLWQIAWKRADGSRESEVLVEGMRGQNPHSFTPDGQHLVYDALAPDATSGDIWIVPLDGPLQARPLVSGPFRKREGAISPDGRWLAYVSNEAGPESVYVRPFPDGEGRWQISTPQGSEPRWSHDGRELFYLADAGLYRVAVDTSRGFTAARPERLIDRVASGTEIHTYSPAPDGARILTFRSVGDGTALRTLHFESGFGRRIAAALAAQR